MSKIVELAEKLNNFENPHRIGPSIGEVIQVDPLKIRIAGGLIDLEEGEELEVCERLKQHTRKASISWITGDGSATVHGTLSGTVSGDVSGTVTGGVTGTVTGPSIGDITDADLTIDPGIEVGDLIFVIPEIDDEDGEQTWIAVDKIATGGGG